MSDRKLLELAAKAAGEVAGDWIGNPHYMNGVLMRWSPLTDDGDALRLAVKLGLCVSACEKRKDTMVGYSLEDKGYNLMEDWDADPFAATRRAIVRAAAEIGRNMK